MQPRLQLSPLPESLWLPLFRRASSQPKSRGSKLSYMRIGGACPLALSHYRRCQFLGESAESSWHHFSPPPPPKMMPSIASQDGRSILKLLSATATAAMLQQQPRSSSCTSSSSTRERTSVLPLEYSTTRRQSTHRRAFLPTACYAFEPQPKSHLVAVQGPLRAPHRLAASRAHVHHPLRFFGVLGAEHGLSSRRSEEGPSPARLLGAPPRRRIRGLLPVLQQRRASHDILVYLEPRAGLLFFHSKKKETVLKTGHQLDVMSFSSPTSAPLQ